MFYNIFFKRVIHWYLSRMLGEAVRDMVHVYDESRMSTIKRFMYGMAPNI